MKSFNFTMFLNISNALLGVTIFAMPWGFGRAGIAGSFLVLTFVAYLAYDTSTIMLRVQRALFLQTNKVATFPEIAGSILGTPYNPIIKAATCISCFGGCCGYLIFLGSLSSQLLAISYRGGIVVSTVPLVFISWIRSFKELSWITIFGCMSLIFAIGFIEYDGYVNSKPTSTLINVDIIRVNTILDFVGPVTFLFTIHYCLLSMGAEILVTESKNENSPSSPSQIPLSSVSSSLQALHGEDAMSKNVANMEHPTSSSSSHIQLLSSVSSSSSGEATDGLISALAAAYILAVCGIMFFGGTTLALYKDADYVRNPRTGEILESCMDRICQNILTNLAPGLLNNLVGLLLIVSTIPSYILILTPVREHVEVLLLNYWHRIIQYDATSFSEDVGKNIIRSALVLGTSVIAIQDPNFGSTLGAVGGLTDAFQAFIVPIIIFFYLRVSAVSKDPSNSSSSTASISSRQQQLSKTQNLFYCTTCGWGVSIISYTFSGVLLGEQMHINYFLVILIASTMIMMMMCETIVMGLVCHRGKRHYEHRQHESDQALSSHTIGNFEPLDMGIASSTATTIAKAATATTDSPWSTRTV